MLGDLPVYQIDEDCATFAVQSGVPISDDLVLIDSIKSVHFKEKYEHMNVVAIACNIFL